MMLDCTNDNPHHCDYILHMIYVTFVILANVENNVIRLGGRGRSPKDHQISQGERGGSVTIAKLSLNSTQLNSTSISIEAEIALFPVSDKPPTNPPTNSPTRPPVEVVIWRNPSPVNNLKTLKLF